MISVIIPAYNEEKTIGRLLDNIAAQKNVEVIVVDGGSSDRTEDVVKSYPVKVIRTRKQRALQCNKGAEIAKGRMLVFLHADCVFQEGSLDAISNCIDKGFIGGCLRQQIDIDKGIYRFIENSGNLRAKMSKIFYGDQAIFVRSDIFSQIGGFDRVDLFDDVLFSKKMKKAGKTCLLDKKVYTSPRRWQRQGLLKTTFINWLLSLGFILGVSPRLLKKVYFDIR